MGKKVFKIFPIIIVIAAILFLFFIEIKKIYKEIKKEHVTSDVEYEDDENLKINEKKDINVNININNEIENNELNINEIVEDVEEIKENKDLSYWKVIEKGNNYNNELQYYLKENVEFTEESIKIISKKESNTNGDYTSGRVESSYVFKYGYFEFVIEISEGKGLFPAIWLLPQNDAAYPEIDIFEMIGSNPYEFYGVVHYIENDNKEKEYCVYTVTPKKQYKVALKWESDQLTWYVDDKIIFTSNKGVPQEYMYIIINQAIGGNWPGDPDDKVFPAFFNIVSYKIESEIKEVRY